MKLTVDVRDILILKAVLQNGYTFGKEQILHIDVTTQQHRSTRVTLEIGSHAHHRHP